jgi:hypothetical protein
MYKLGIICVFAIALDWIIFFQIQNYLNSTMRSKQNSKYYVGPLIKIILALSYVSSVSYISLKKMDEPNIYWMIFGATFFSYFAFAVYNAVKS